MFVLDSANFYRYIEVRAEVTVEPDSDLAFLKRLLTAYDSDLDFFGGDKDERWMITFAPVHVVAFG